MDGFHGFGAWLGRLDALVWGPWLTVLLLGTGLYLMVRMRFLPLRNLGWALGQALRGGFQERKAKKGEGVSPFSSLMTELAATIGTGNIVGVATAMVLGGPGALFWMVLSSFVGLSTKLAESALAVRYRVFGKDGRPMGGPMYTLSKGLAPKRAGRVLAALFAVFAVLSSFGMGNMVQANSIAEVMEGTFGVGRPLAGLFLTLACILAVLGGIRSISKVAQVLVPGMALLYLAGCAAIIFTHLHALPEGLWMILSMALSPRSVAGGVGGHLAGSFGTAFRWGVSRGVFSNEAGLGASGISAASAQTDDPILQGYISMTGVFLDTAVVCTMTGLALASSGVLGKLAQNGEALTGAALVSAAFRTTFGPGGILLAGLGIILFAFATILGWAYQGETAFTYLVRARSGRLAFRFFYALASLVGAVCPLGVAWDFSDLCNGLMAIPNLICLIALSGEICRDVRLYGKRKKRFQKR